MAQVWSGLVFALVFTFFVVLWIVHSAAFSLALFSVGCALMAFASARVRAARVGDVPLWMSSGGARTVFNLLTVATPFAPMAFAVAAGVTWWHGFPAFLGAVVVVFVVGLVERSLLNVVVELLLGVALVGIAAFRVVSAQLAG